MTPEDSERSSDERDGAPAAPRGESDAGPRDPKESLARRANRVRARLLALHVLLTVGKLAAGSALGSFALIADAANSLREVGASIPSLFVTRRIGKRRHARHPFDHGKIEAAASKFQSHARGQIHTEHGPPKPFIAPVSIFRRIGAIQGQ